MSAPTSLSALTSIGESSPGGYLGIDYNNALASVDLSALVTVEECLYITHDPVLDSLDLSALTSVGWEFEVNNNDLLPDCDVCAILDHTVTATGGIAVHDNLDDTCTPVPANCP